jgi:hypothetical protein
VFVFIFPIVIPRLARGVVLCGTAVQYCIAGIDFIARLGTIVYSFRVRHSLHSTRCRIRLHFTRIQPINRKRYKYVARLYVLD